MVSNPLATQSTREVFEAIRKKAMELDEVSVFLKSWDSFNVRTNIPIPENILMILLEITGEMPSQEKIPKRITHKKLEYPSCLSPTLKTSPFPCARLSAYRKEM